MGAAGVGEEGIPRAYLMEVLGRRLGETGWSTASAKGTCNRDAAGGRRTAAAAGGDSVPMTLGMYRTLCGRE
jgi:hypothetical protein